MTTMAQPHARGPVDIAGVTTRDNKSTDRWCWAHPKGEEPIAVGAMYERVRRADGTVESYTPECFETEFGRRELYGA